MRAILKKKSNMIVNHPVKLRDILYRPFYRMKVIIYLPLHTLKQTLEKNFVFLQLLYNFRKFTYAFYFSGKLISFLCSFINFSNDSAGTGGL